MSFSTVLIGDWKHNSAVEKNDKQTGGMHDYSSPSLSPSSQFFRHSHRKFGQSFSPQKRKYVLTASLTPGQFNSRPIQQKANLIKGQFNSNQI
jgi:hypothetical protein